ncbi:pggt1b [Trichonephila clavipes]|nr:pggt1b [Trichonephila clavipes]
MLRHTPGLMEYPMYCFANILFFIQPREYGGAGVSYSAGQEAIVIQSLKPGKMATDPRAIDRYSDELPLCLVIFFRSYPAKEPFPIPTLEYATVPLYQPFATYSKSTVAPVVFQRVFAYHRSQYSRYSAIYTDGSKRADYVGCGVVIEDIMHGYRLDTSCSIFTAEAVAIYRALQLIDSTMPRKYCIYTDSMSVLEALENYHDRCHPVVCTILDITSRLYSKGFDIVFCWLPSHVGIIGNEQADNACPLAHASPVDGRQRDMKPAHAIIFLSICGFNAKFFDNKARLLKGHRLQLGGANAKN